MEDGDIEEENLEYEEQQNSPAAKQQPRPKPQGERCNQRLDELSTPGKRMFLALWNEHGHHLPKDKVDHLKQLLQQLYAMTPEETAKYFAELRAEMKARDARRKLKQRLRKILVDKYRRRERRRAFKLFRRILTCAIRYAATNPIPEIISSRMNYLSDVCLEHLCNLRGVDFPDRLNPDKLGTFLISVADWMAIAIERVYYNAQMKINNEMTTENSTLPNQIDETLRVLYDIKDDDDNDPNDNDGSSSLKQSVEDTYQQFAPPHQSTPKKASKS